MAMPVFRPDFRIFCYDAFRRPLNRRRVNGETRDLLGRIPYLFGMGLAFAIGFLCVTAALDDATQGPVVNLALDWSAAVAWSSHAKSPPISPAPVRQAALPPAPPQSAMPAPRPAPPAPLAHSLTRLVALKSSPFPYDGVVPRTSKPFLNYSRDGRTGRKTPGGRVYWADETYSDNRSLLHIPKGFDLERPAAMVVFFHGHGATLQRDVAKRQQLPGQINRSRMNAVLVAPQLAVDARDSSAGNLWREGGMRRFLDETAAKLAEIHGAPGAKKKFTRMPVIIVGYSGGYHPAAMAIANGGIEDRLKGVVLLDGLYGNIDTFANWIARDNGGFFVSAYTGSTRKGHAALKARLDERDIGYGGGIPRRLGPGSVALIAAEEEHRHYVTRAWTDYPVSDILARLDGIAPRDPVAVSASLSSALTN